MHCVFFNQILICIKHLQIVRRCPKIFLHVLREKTTSCNKGHTVPRSFSVPISPFFPPSTFSFVFFFVVPFLCLSVSLPLQTLFQGNQRDTGTCFLLSMFLRSPCSRRFPPLPKRARTRSGQEAIHLAFGQSLRRFPFP